MADLLITGRLAEEEVREVARTIGADVLVLPVDVARFMRVQMVLDSLRKMGKKIQEYDRVIFPGEVDFDVSRVEAEFGVPCFRGPAYVRDLRTSLSKGLSRTTPSEKPEQGMEGYKRVFLESERKPAKFMIGGLKIGGFQPRIVAEIVDAVRMEDDEVVEKARYYINSGADIIDIGCVASDEDPARVFELVKLLKKTIRAPISVDSLSPAEINEGIRAGADLVLSLTSENIKEVERWPTVAYVVVPDAEENIFGVVREAERRGFKKIIADPVLSPPFSLAAAVSRYHDFRKVYHSMPLLMGGGNLTELIDADSIGINGVISALAIELGVSLLLSTENSEKTRNAIRELRRGVEMCFLAKSIGGPPKDLGINLLLAKSKRPGEVFRGRARRIIPVGEAEGIDMDRAGYFRIFVDFDKSQIIAAHFKQGCDYVFEGASAESICKEIIKRRLVSNLQHAAYLGRELQKAEVSLHLKRSYIQDEDFPEL